MSNTGSETDDLIGTTVGEHYRITAVLARGPNGVVYEATDDEVDEVCVVKVFDGARSADDEALVRMVRETRAVTTPPHANVATVYAAGALADGRPYVAMQRLLGPTFAELVARGQPVAPARVAELLSGVAKALDHAHRLGVTHGALHGRNVVLTISVESGEVAKVLDLGTLSLRAWPPADEEHVAPESKLNAPSPEMDVYALAVLACRLLTGESPAELRAAAAARTGPSERERVVLGTELEDVLARALARDPKRRPWPATELVRELRAAAARIAAAPSSGPKAAPSGAPPRTLQGVGRDRGGHDTLMDRGGGRATSGSSDRLRAVAAPRLPPSSSPPRPSSSSLPPRPSVPSSIPRPSSSSLPPRPSSSPRPSPTSPRPRPGAPSGPSAPAPAAAAPEQRAPIEAPPAAPVASPDPAPTSAVIALPAPIVVVGSAEPDAPVVASPAAAAVAPPVPPAGPATALPASDAPAGPRDPRLPRTLELPIGSPPVAASEPQVAPVEAAPAVIESPRPPASASAGLDLADDDEEPRPRRSPVVPIAIVLTLLVGAAVAAYFVYRSRIATAPEGVATNASTGSGQPPSPVAAP
ncbi:MAG: serine/threonine protein kinase, partial [Deltaproteobacteria bacterium]|nr:serine/threonine protein kinase [Deltaproteobacteria bacterium]